ncbi:hypothetical protein E1A91_D04G032100v1 [Gossypium mustelinum]|uniref:Uncharacterized protein n=1 Tax=Gossypium mustelinum TaxID=34275 RepID=A0A5D2V9G1_GOSMU|nr:hypothetical protein E1A91_D04G032100v1 [Gossypium mustelinum]
MTMEGEGTRSPGVRPAWRYGGGRTEVRVAKRRGDARAGSTAVALDAACCPRVFNFLLVLGCGYLG